jgi:hypothetical protein
MIRKELEKKLKVLEKTLNQIDAMKLEANADPATAPAFGDVVSELDKARKRQLKGTKKKLLDEDMLKGLVLNFEVLRVHDNGVTKEYIYERLSAHKDYSKSKVKKLWNDKRVDDPEKIEELRLQIAFAFVSQFIERQVKNPPENSGGDVLVNGLKKNNPALFRWAWETAVQNLKGDKYEESDETLEVNTIALMREIASAD